MERTDPHRADIEPRAVEHPAFDLDEVAVEHAPAARQSIHGDADRPMIQAGDPGHPPVTLAHWVFRLGARAKATDDA